MRHDMLPWDDDIDLRISMQDREKFNTMVIRELSSEPYYVVIAPVPGFRIVFDKVFFAWCPLAGGKFWRYPFIDIFYHDTNSTHIWQAGRIKNRPDRHPVRLEAVFPLVLRPLGPLWLYAPREPMAHFDSQDMRNIETKCWASSFNHRVERFVKDRARSAMCSQLTSTYPYVDRQCTSDSCTEYLKLGETTIIHKIRFPLPYDTCKYSRNNLSYRSC